MYEILLDLCASAPAVFTAGTPWVLSLAQTMGHEAFTLGSRCKLRSRMQGSEQFIMGVQSRFYHIFCSAKEAHMMVLQILQATWHGWLTPGQVRPGQQRVLHLEIFGYGQRSARTGL